MKMTQAWTWASSAALCVASASQVWANDADIDALRQELQALRQEVAELRSNQTGMTDAQRRELLDAQIERAYADAKRLASERQDPLAGISDGGNLFFRSADGMFTAETHALIQTRYIWNSLDTDNAGAGSNRGSDSLSGFQIRRVRAGIKGSFGDGWGYKMRISTNRAASSTSRTFTDSGGDTVTIRDTTDGAGDVFTEEFYITYKFNDNWKMKVGVDQLPFARQEMVNGRDQVSVDRALATEFFTLNRADLAQIDYQDDDIHGRFALSDGGNNKFSGVFSDATNDFAVTGRIDWQAIGSDWDQNENEFAGVAKEDALFIGGAFHYQQTEGLGSSNADSGLAWTADFLYKVADLAFSAAVFGQHTENIAGFTDTDQYGFYFQGDYKFASQWNAFARWDWIDDDDNAGANTEALQAVTVGLNHDFNAFVRLTGDVVYIYTGDAPSADGNFINGGALSSSMGLTGAGFGAGDDHDGQVALRLQLQVKF